VTPGGQLRCLFYKDAHKNSGSSISTIAPSLDLWLTNRRTLAGKGSGDVSSLTTFYIPPLKVPLVLKPEVSIGSQTTAGK